MRTRRTSPFGRSVMGICAIAAGAITGGAGTIGWVSLLAVPSVVVAALGVLFLGVVPIVIGLGMIWTGLDVLTERIIPPAMICDERLIQTAGDGATREQVLERLQLIASDMPEIERRLDRLVVAERVELVVTDAGKLLYFAVPSRSSWLS